MSTFAVFIDSHCQICNEARALVAEMSDLFPTLQITLHDSGREDWPSKVFAVPTYMLNGRIISLGNPSREQLHQQLNEALSYEPTQLRTLL